MSWQSLGWNKVTEDANEFFNSIGTEQPRYDDSNLTVEPYFDFYTPCVQSSDCGSGYGCVNGRCVQLSGGNTTSGSDGSGITAGPAFTPTLPGSCNPSNPDSGCGTSTGGSACDVPGCGNNPIPDPDTCCGGERCCRLIDDVVICYCGPCEPDDDPLFPPTFPCEDDSNCPAGTFCVNGTCTSNCTPGSCPAGYTCVLGRCVLNCDGDADCPDGTFCYGGQCIPACEIGTITPEGYTCNKLPGGGGVGTPGRPCGSCPPGQRCISGQCQPPCGLGCGGETFCVQGTLTCAYYEDECSQFCDDYFKSNGELKEGCTPDKLCSECSVCDAPAEGEEGYLTPGVKTCLPLADDEKPCWCDSGSSCGDCQRCDRDPNSSTLGDCVVDLNCLVCQRVVDVPCRCDDKTVSGSSCATIGAVQRGRDLQAEALAKALAKCDDDCPPDPDPIDCNCHADCKDCEICSPDAKCVYDIRCDEEEEE